MRTASFPPVTDLGQASALPRMEASVARAFNRLYRVQAPMAAELSKQACELVWRLPASTALSPGTFDVYGFQIGRQTGHLGLEPLTQSLVLNERRAALLPRELRYVLLADALSGFVQKLEQATRQRFEWTLPDAAHGAPQFDPLRAACFELGLPAGAPRRCGGYIQFDDGASLDKITEALCGPAEAGPAIDWLTLPLAFELGRTPIRLQEISGIHRGDIISIEEWQSIGTGIVARLVLGHGHVTSLTALMDDNRITLQPWKEFSVSTTSPLASAPTDTQNAASAALGRLDSMEVALRFEVGELSVSLRELRSIRPGHVFELTQPLNNSTVRIFAHGNMLGTGHLVAVGDRLGVRVVEFAPDAHE